MQLTLADLRSMAAMAQFSEREIRPDVLRLIEQSGHLAGDAMVSVEPDKVQLLDAQKVSS